SRSILPLQDPPQATWSNEDNEETPKDSAVRPFLLVCVRHPHGGNDDRKLRHWTLNALPRS
ncbi:MAG: hypothetical protein ACTHM1_09000, partial [Solirubrobacteraceae bacterium]